MRSFSERRFQLLAAVALGSVALFGWMSWRSITTPGPIWLEGPAAGAMKAIEAGRLYHPEGLSQPAYSVLTHTPLSYWLGYLVWSQAPGLGALRFLNVLYSILGSLLIFRIVRSIVCPFPPDRTWFAPITAAASFLLCQPVFSWSQMARSPDSLATLLSLGVISLTLQRRSPRASWKSHAVIALLIALAVFSKQTAVLTLSLTLLWHHGRLGEWRIAALRIAGAALLVVAAMGGLLWASNGGFWLNTVAANLVRQDWAKAVVYVLLPLGPFWLWIALVWWFGRNTAAAKSPERLVHRWFVVSLLVGLVTCMKDGSDAMYFFDVSAAAALLLGLAMHHAPAAREPALAWVMIAATVLMVTAGDVPYFVRNDALVRRQAHDMPAALARLPGDILADEASLPIALGRRWWWDDPFILREMERQGRWNSAPILRRIQAKTFSGILVRRVDFWPDSLRVALAVAYHPGPVFPSHELTYTLYLPNR